MRRRLAFGLVVLVATLAACSGASSSNDPYQLVFKARNVGFAQVQVDLSLNAVNAGQTIALEPGAIRLVVDTTAGKGLFHLSIPTSLLGTAAASLGQLGISGATIDADILYDGTALYARSPLAPTLLQLLFASSGQLPTGDLTSWLKLGTAADFASLMALGGGIGAVASTAPAATLADAGAMKTSLNNAGITLTFVATEQHNGVNADHVSAAIDWAKLSASGPQSAASQAQVQQVLTALQGTTATFDLWIDHSSGRFSAIEVKGASKTDATQTFDVNLSLKTPDAGTSLDAPASSVDVPLMQLIGPLLQSFMGAGLTP